MAIYLCYVLGALHTQLVGILVVVQQVGQQGHHIEGEGEGLRWVHHRQLQQQRESSQQLCGRLIRCRMSAALEQQCVNPREASRPLELLLELLNLNA